MSSLSFFPSFLTFDILLNHLSLLLSIHSRRKLTINKYRGSLYVDLREYYSTKQGGDLAPTQRGISLTGEQWQKVVEALPDLEMALSGASKISQS